VANTTGDSARETTVERQSLQVCCGLIGAICTDRVEIMMDPKGSKGAPATDGAGVQARNTILVAMEDLVEADRKEREKELEEEMAERHQKKLVCFQKTCNEVVKKANTATASGAKVSTSLSLEDLVHMVDVFVASKYGVDLTQFTRLVVVDMKSMLDAFKQDFNSNLPRQVRAMVQQINGESQGKRMDGFPVALNQGSASNQVRQGVLDKVFLPTLVKEVRGQTPTFSNISTKRLPMGQTYTRRAAAYRTGPSPMFSFLGLLHHILLTWRLGTTRG
jgi:hypothetical protein